MSKFFKIILLFATIIVMFGCERDYMYRGGAEGLYFSQDTVKFDTIFTTIGSATHHLKIYNPYGVDMTIEEIRLAGGDYSKFRLNINGFPENSQEEIPLRGNDSLTIYIEITIDPSESITSFFAEDSIMFYTKERIQSVRLEAYIQDVIVIRQETIKENTTFKKDKPYLIFDYLLVDSLQTLTIEAGARLHFYTRASLQVLGTLIVEGTKEEPVCFLGHRLEKQYADVPGQWGYIHLRAGSKDHFINHAIIKNSFYGIQVDSVGLEDSKPVEIMNTQLNFISKHGLVAQTSAIVAENCVFGNCGGASVALTVGGKYEFYHSTIANFNSGRYVGRSFPALVLSNYYLDKNNKPVTSNLYSASFYNCIISGSAQNELNIDLKKHDLGVTNWEFNHSLIQSSASKDSLANKKLFKEIVVNEDVFFINAENANFQLDTLSGAKDKGDLNIVLSKERLQKDILGNSRIEDRKPDLGAYERIERQ